MTRLRSLFVALSVVLCGQVLPEGAAAQPPDPLRIMASARAASMSPRWPRRPLIEAATEAAGIVTLRERFGLMGEGATICIVDTGLDLSHRDFRDEVGQTRVSWLFDFESAPRGAHRTLEERFGAAVWSGEELDASDDAPGDVNGHGTAVAAVAAGDDATLGESPGPQAGAAPRASLIVVKLPLALGLGFTDPFIVRGTEACFAVGDPSRTVAVLSFGGHDGRHDGSEPLDVALDALAEGGARIVVSAGNDGAQPIHATGTLGRRSAVTLPLFVPAPEPAGASPFVALTISAPFAARVSVDAPDGTHAGPVGLGGRAEAEGTRASLLVDGTVAADPGGGTIYIVIAGAGAASFGGEYEITVETSGRFDAWIVDHDLGAVLLGPRLSGPFVEASGTVTVPGTASGVITVGASITRTSVATNRGVTSIDGVPGEIALFSSLGPPPGAQVKPDLVAPGALVLTALSSDVVEGDPNNLFRGALGRVERARAGADRIALSGTSFTAPLVAGVLALGLADGASDGDLDRLRFTARPLAEAPWTGRAGFGVLDATAFLRPEPRADSASLVATAPVDVGSPRLFIAGRITADGSPFEGAVDLFHHDSFVGSVDARAGLVRARMPPPMLAPGEVLMLEARIDGVRVGDLDVRGRVDAARERFPPSVSGGGMRCGAVGADHQREWPLPSLFPLLAMFVLSRRGRRLRSRKPRRRDGSRRRARGRRLGL